MATKTPDTLVTAEGTMRAIAPANPQKGYTLDEIQDLVGGYVVFLPLGEGLVLLVDEEGLMKGKTFNPYASALAGQPIVGDVAIVSRKALK